MLTLAEKDKSWSILQLIMSALERYLLQLDKSLMVTVTPRDSYNALNTIDPMTMIEGKRKQLNRQCTLVFIGQPQSLKPVN